MDQPIGHAVISVRVTAVLSKLALEGGRDRGHLP